VQNFLDPLRPIRFGRQRACTGEPAHWFCRQVCQTWVGQLLGKSVRLVAGQACLQGGTNYLADRRNPLLSHAIKQSMSPVTA
jgi:hypothetical protein